MLPLACDALESAHVRLKRIWNQDRAVGLLIVFDNGQPSAAYGEAAAVQCVNEFELALCALSGLTSRGPVTDVGAARLKGFKVGAGRNLPVKLLAGKPDLEIEGLGRGETGVAGAKKNAAIGKAEGLENLFGVAGEALVLAVGVFGARELDHLDFLKLMLPDDAPRVLARGSSFGAEAGRVGRESDGQAGFVEDFVAVEIGDGNLGGGDEPVVIKLRFFVFRLF